MLVFLNAAIIISLNPIEHSSKKLQVKDYAYIDIKTLQGVKKQEMVCEKQDSENKCPSLLQRKYSWEYFFYSANNVIC